MNDALNSRAGAFLRSVQDADEPTREDFERVRAGVKARLAAGVAAGVATLLTAKAASGAAATTTTAAATTAAATGAAIGVATASATVPPAAIASTGVGAALLTKIVAAVIVTGAVAGGVTAVVRHERATNVFPPSTSVAALPAALKPPPPLPRRPPTLAQSPALTPSALVAQSPNPAPPPAFAPATAAATTPQPASPAVPSSLDAEISLLRDARSALQGGNPSARAAAARRPRSPLPRGCPRRGLRRRARLRLLRHGRSHPGPRAGRAIPRRVPGLAPRGLGPDLLRELLTRAISKTVPLRPLITLLGRLDAPLPTVPASPGPARRFS